MCILAAAAPLVGAVGAGGGAAAAAGAAASAGSILQTAGLVTGVVGSLWQAGQASAAAQQQIDAIQTQKEQTLQLNAVQDHRFRQQFGAQIATQRAELAARGIDLGSPSAVYLGQSAARELAFGSAAIRQEGKAQATEMTAQQRALQARGKAALLKGGFSAAGQVLTAAPDMWPELLS
ncbi:MAG: hypothetical protein GYB50_20545 [Rhodobacteraceae bacterium]|nr:hypothetical protein [Paracoccaceae bacterium]